MTVVSLAHRVVNGASTTLKGHSHFSGALTSVSVSSASPLLLGGRTGRLNDTSICDNPSRIHRSTFDGAAIRRRKMNTLRGHSFARIINSLLLWTATRTPR